MSHDAKGPFGSRLISLWWHDLLDRIHGRRYRSQGRWGRIRPPLSTGKVIWIWAGASATSVLLAAELLGALRQKRLDARLVLTYENEYPEILTPRLKNLPKIGFGFGPCDRTRAITRALTRLDPLGVIVVGDAPGPHFLNTIAKHAMHRVAVQTACPITAGDFELCVPSFPMSNMNGCQHVESPADYLTLLTTPQVEPTFGKLVAAGGQVQQLWWVHGVDKTSVQALLNLWRESPLNRNSVLVLSVEHVDKSIIPSALEGEIVPLSTWDRQAMSPGQLLWIDDERWLASVAASVQAIHLCADDRRVYWQSLASGAYVTTAAALPSVTAWQHGLSTFDDFRDVLAQWATWQGESTARRQQGDRLRRLFWDARRQANQSLEQLLNRIYDW